MKRNMVQALNRALATAMERDPDVVILGEDVGIDGGVFRVTDGLIESSDPNGSSTPLWPNPPLWGLPSAWPPWPEADRGNPIYGIFLPSFQSDFSSTWPA